MARPHLNSAQRESWAAPGSGPVGVLAALALTGALRGLCSQVLWPYLMEFLVPAHFTEALTPLCRSLVHLALKRQEAGTDAFLVQFEAHGAHSPGPPSLDPALCLSL